MAEKAEIIQAIGYFNGYKTKGTYDVELNFKFGEDQLPNVLQFLSGLGNDLSLLAVVYDEKVRLGSFSLYNLTVDRDANAKVRFKSNVDKCFINNFRSLLLDEETPIILKAKVVERNN